MVKHDGGGNRAEVEDPWLESQPIGLETPPLPAGQRESYERTEPSRRRRKTEEREERHIPDAGPLFGPWGKWGTKRDGWVTD